MFLQVKKKVDWNLYGSNAATFLGKAGLFFQEKSDSFQIFATSVHRICHEMTFSKTVIIERCSADRNLMIETTIAEIDKTVYQHDSYKYAFIDKFRVLGFHSEEPHAIFDNRVPIYKYKNGDWDINWRNVAGTFGEI